MKKSIVSFLVMLIIFATNRVNADSNRYEYNKEFNYPGYNERIDAIKSKHPNWKFVIMETGIEWEEVIRNEYVGHHTSPKNLIQGKAGGWICSLCGQEIFDTGNWMCASEQAIRYYMDPRNWLMDSPYLFQFLQINYDETTDADVYSSLNGTFLYSWENASLINRVCRESDANPYFIIARIIQEQGTKGGQTYKMQGDDGKIYYNLFNIGAGGNGNEVYENALKKAKEQGWTSIESCIRGGISFLLSSYIQYKQNTIYLNKFDVESYNGLYTKQYMQNIEAPKSEATSMYNKMKQANLLDKNLTFIIPVYQNMPELASNSPEERGELYPKNIRVKLGHSRIVLRAGQGTDTEVLKYINDSETIILSVERYNNGWHRVILTDGTKGFIKFNTDYLEEINDITNCKETMIVKEKLLLKVGPGAEEKEITTLMAGEEVTRIDNSGIYNFDGEIWDRVRISDGRQGFIERRYLMKKSNENNNQNEENATNNETIGNQVNDVFENNDIVENKTTNEADEEQQTNEIHQTNEIDDENNEISNKIDENQQNNEIIDENQQTNEIEDNTNSTDTNTGEEEEKYIIVSYDMTAEEMEGSITKNGENVEFVGTGCILEKNGEEYIIIKLGDVNGDGYVKANDYLIIKDYIMEKITLEKEYLKSADVTKDTYVKANDYLKIKDHIMYGIEI